MSGQPSKSIPQEYMGREILSQLWAYNSVANQKLLTALESLGIEEMMHTASPSRESVWRLVNHIYLVEVFFLHTCLDKPGRPRMAAHLAELLTKWEVVSKAGSDYLRTATGTELLEIIPVTMQENSFQFARWQLLLRAVTHSIQHRGELSIILSQIGNPLPNLDLIVHLAETRGIEWPWK